MVSSAGLSIHMSLMIAAPTAAYDRLIPSEIYVHLDNGESHEATPEDLAKFGLEAAGMMRAAKREVQQEHLQRTEYVLGVEVWGVETHGIHDSRGHRVDLIDSGFTIYWYRATIVEHPPAGPPRNQSTSQDEVGGLGLTNTRK